MLQIRTRPLTRICGLTILVTTLLFVIVESRGHGGGGGGGRGGGGGWQGGRASSRGAHGGGGGRGHIKFTPTNQKIYDYKEQLGGTYSVVSKAGYVKYIGQTNNFKRRTNEHIRSSPFIKHADTFKYRPKPLNTIHESEKNEIAACRAGGGCLFNKHPGGNGRRVKTLSK